MDFDGGGGGLAIVAGCVIKSAGTFISSTNPVVLYQFRSGGGRGDEREFNFHAVQQSIIHLRIKIGVRERRRSGEV